MLFFLKDAMIVQKTNFSYFSPEKSTLNESKLPVHIWIYSTRKKKSCFFGKKIGVLVAAWTTRRKRLG
jgi:hypothetical protein